VGSASLPPQLGGEQLSQKIEQREEGGVHRSSSRSYPLPLDPVVHDLDHERERFPPSRRDKGRRLLQWGDVSLSSI
jgi:hypothetical protein